MKEEEAALGLNSRTFIRFFLCSTPHVQNGNMQIYLVCLLKKKKVEFFPLKNGIPTLVYYFRHVS